MILRDSLTVDSVSRQNLALDRMVWILLVGISQILPAYLQI